ncbi:MAG: flagellar motor protein MotB [Terracidiphilus sp.]|jgi:chemotaxis protein MotB
MKERRKGNISRDRWMVSYADFITLLFAFFVVLFAFAKADQKKQVQVTEAIDSAFHSMGVFPGANSAAGDDHATLPMNTVMQDNVLSPARVKEDLEHLHRELEQSLSSQIASHTVSMKMDRTGLVISLREAGFFSSGSATPRPEALPALRQVAASLSRTPYDLRIEGHTDNIPIHTAEFDSNWELSSARATHIAHIFIDLKAIPPERISAAGYSEFHPAAGNDTAEGRSENRRVDLVVLPRTKIDLSAPESNHPAGPWRKITDEDASAQGASTSPTPPPAP